MLIHRYFSKMQWYSLYFLHEFMNNVICSSHIKQDQFLLNKGNNIHNSPYLYLLNYSHKCNMIILSKFKFLKQPALPANFDYEEMYLRRPYIIL